MTQTKPDEADLLWEFDAAIRDSAEVNVGDWLSRWPDVGTRDSIACSLLRCACEQLGFDFLWLSEQLVDPQISLDQEVLQQLLLDVFLDQVASSTTPTWDDYQPLGYPASELQLKLPEDRCYLGQILDGRYVLQSRLANGGLATVYQSYDQQSQSNVAIKIPLRKPLDTGDFLAQRIRDEARILAAISLPGIPQYYELLELAEGPALVTALVEGVTLQSVVPAGGLPEEEALLLTSKVAHVADGVHQAGFVHGDIKANNILVNDRGEVTLVDFNVSRLDDPAQMKDGFPGGTLPAMSPEAIVGAAADVDLRQDVYALGTLLHFCISSEELFSSENREEAVVKSILFSGVHEPKFPEGTTEPVRQVCLAAISQQPASRFETAGDFALTCERIVANATGKIEIPPQRPRLAAWRLGSALGMMLVRQRRVSIAFENLDSLNPTSGDNHELANALGYAMGVTTALEEVRIHAGQLGEQIESWDGAEEYASALYRQSRLQAEDLKALAPVVTEGERWCAQLLGNLQTSLIERLPSAAAFFMAATQAQMAPYSKDAAKRWQQVEATLSAPKELTEDFSRRCQVYAGHETLLSAVSQLDYEIVKWLRWEAVEDRNAIETGGK